MKAVILAAGKGTRMKELTTERPKPMLYVQGKPILQHIIEGIKEAGITEIFIVTGYRADVIENYFKDGSQFGVKLFYGKQTVQDGTGSALRVAKEFVKEDTFIATYGDILVKPYNYIAILEKFNSSDYDGLITITRGEDYTKGGLLFFNEKFLLEHLVEKPSKEQIEELKNAGYIRDDAIYWYNAGIYIFKPVVFSFIEKIEKSPRGEYELTDAILKLVQSGYKLVGFEIEGRWVDVRDPIILAKLESEQPD